MTRLGRPVFLLNLNAREGRARARLERALKAAPSLARSAEIVTVGSRAEARAVVRTLTADSVPVAAGGDGTVNLVAGALWEEKSDHAMGVLPLGTGNAFAIPLGLGSLARALAALGAGTERLVDLMVTTHPEAPVATVSISVGFESRLLQAGTGRRAGWRWIAVVGGLAGAAASRSTGIALTADGETVVLPGESVYNVGLYNLPCYGFGWRMWPDADAADGIAEAVVCVSGRVYWRTLRHGLSTARRLEGDPRTRRWQHARVESAVPIQVDGEVVGAGRFEVHVEPQALRVVAPPL